MLETTNTEREGCFFLFSFICDRHLCSKSEENHFATMETLDKEFFSLSPPRLRKIKKENSLRYTLRLKSCYELELKLA